MFILDKPLAALFHAAELAGTRDLPRACPLHRPCPIAILALLSPCDLCMRFVRETRRVWNRSSDKIMPKRVKYFGGLVSEDFVGRPAYRLRDEFVLLNCITETFTGCHGWVRAVGLLRGMQIEFVLIRTVFAGGAAVRCVRCSYRYSCARDTKRCLLVVHCWRLQKRDTKRAWWQLNTASKLRRTV